MLASALRGARCSRHLAVRLDSRRVLPTFSASRRPLLLSRCCGTQREHGPPVRVVERNLSDFIDVVILPLRHTVYSVNLWTLRFVFPGCWNFREFHSGAPQAFRHITEHMEDRDLRPLDGTVSDDLIQELRAEAVAAEESGSETKAAFQAVVDARLMGIFTVSARSDDAGDAAVFVTGLLKVVEEYAPVAESDAGPIRPWHVHRIHKWTFKRQLPSEDSGGEPGDWQVVAMNKRRWRPPENLSA
mmetsp:Transcript_36577/g.73758  ORF Transcript_36577/g.73758 Transcript_36577/m.73758 type:complete len:244 (-) Transcript_36577:133-864(-)